MTHPAPAKAKTLKAIARHLTGMELESLIRQSAQAPLVKAPRGQTLTRSDVAFVAGYLGRSA